jgi:transposase-like protein
LATAPGNTVAEVSKELGADLTVVADRVSTFQDGHYEASPGKPPLKSESQSELGQLRRELARVRMERSIPKKGARLLREGPDVRFGFIAKHRAVWPVRVLCEVLEASASGFYEWLGRQPSKRSVANDKLTGLIRQSFEASDRTYGTRRVWRDVLARGERCGIHRVARLMRAAGLAARRKRRRAPQDADARPESGIAPNLLKREFEADAPNKKWLADFTYIWTTEGWLYVAVVLDLYSRRIVGWSMKPEMTAQLVTDALVMAIWRRGKPKERLHHSDQGASTRVTTSAVCSGPTTSPAA